MQKYKCKYFNNHLDSDGFTVGTDGGRVNTNGNNYASWNWKANGSGSANTDGDIKSTVSANTTAGFSIVKYTGNGSAGPNSWTWFRCNTRYLVYKKI